LEIRLEILTESSRNFPLSRKRIVFTVEVKSGSVIVKIYRVRDRVYRPNLKPKDRFRFTVTHFASGKRTQ